MSDRADIVRAHNENAQRAYQVVFGSPDGRLVLADLIAFCHGRTTTFHENDRVHARNEGRRDVLMRITEFTSLTIDEIYALRGMSRPIAQQEDTDG